MNTALLLEAIELTDAQFDWIRCLAKSACGIDLGDGKKELVRARLTKRLRKLSLRDFGKYIEYVRNDTTGMELTALLDALATNQTSFFREVEHFDHLREKVIPYIVAGAGSDKRRLRIWSAGCSSGEEPYSIAITVREGVPNVDSWDVRILATDISTRVLAQAEKAIYDRERVKVVPPRLQSKYFRVAEARPERLYRVDDRMKRMVHFARLNLMDPWPMKGPFDVIFCRNVMIYFDKPTQGRLVQRFSELLVSGGTLFIGHSESLTGIRHGFRYVQPTVYQKP